MIGRITNKPVLPCGYPVLDASGKVQSVLFATIDLTWFDRLASETQMVKGSTLMLLDRNGTILTRHPEPEKWAGKKMPDSPLLKTILTKHEGVTEAPGLDGALRIYGFLPLRGLPVGEVYVKVGIPKDHIFSSVHRNFVRNLIVFGFVFIAIFFLAWMGGEIFILRPVNVLIKAAKQLSAGDLSVRIKPRPVKGELDQLSYAFDQMAESIEERETELHDFQRRLELAIKAGNVGLWDWDLRTNKVFYSPEWKRQIGYEDHEISNDFNEWQSRVHPDDLGRMLNMIQEYLNNPWPNYAAEFRFRHKDGSYRWILTQASLLMDDTGKPYRMLGSHVDITERKRDEEVLRESERKYRELVQNANSIILRWNPHGEVTFINEFGQSFFGYSESEIRGKHVLDTIVPETETTGRDLRPLMDRICADPKAFENNVNENMRKDGSRVWIAWRNKVVLDESGQVKEILSIGTDITERKRMEEALRAPEEKFAKAFHSSPDIIFYLQKAFSNSKEDRKRHGQRFGIQRDGFNA